MEISPADVAPTEADAVTITINTSTYPDILSDADVTIIPVTLYIGSTGLGIGDRIVSSTFIMNGGTYQANGIDGSADDGSMYMDAQVGKLDIHYLFAPADHRAISEPEFSAVQNELLAIIKTFQVGSSSEESVLPTNPGAASLQGTIINSRSITGTAPLISSSKFHGDSSKFLR